MLKEMEMPGDFLNISFTPTGEYQVNPLDLLEQARGQVDRLTTRPAKLVFVFGIGEGHQLQALLEKWTETRIIAFDPSPESISSALQLTALTTAGSRLTMLSNWDDLYKLMTKEMVFGEHPQAAALISPGYEYWYPQETETFERAIRESRLWRGVIDKTAKEKGHIFRANLAANTGTVMKLPLLTDLKGKVPVRPAFIVGSGPGLEKNGRLLREVKGRGLILAASSAFQPLVNMGVVPDIVVVLESDDTSEYLSTSHQFTDCVLAVGSSAHPRHFQAPGFSLATYHLTAGAAFLFDNHIHVPQGGTSGSAAFTLAYLLGLNPLILMGQDQAYEDGRLHARGTPGDIPEFLNRDDYYVAGKDGQRVRTHSGFVASLHWFLESVRYLQEAAPEVGIINATESGASIPGVPDLSLWQILGHMPENQAGMPSVSALLMELKRPDSREVRINLRQTWDILNSLSRLRKRPWAQVKPLVAEARQLHPYLWEALPTASGSGEEAALWTAVNLTKKQISTMLDTVTAYV